MTDWHSLQGEPLAPRVGPFPHRPFLEACAARAVGEVRIVTVEGAATAVEVTETHVSFLGPVHLTDYHSPLGDDMAALAAALRDEFGDWRLSLDSLPGEAARPLAAGLADVGYELHWGAEEECRVLDISTADPECWEAMLPGKERHELRRKRRRYLSRHGEPVVRRDPALFADFVGLHRMAGGDKGAFMTDEMADFFEALLEVPGARIDALVDGDRALAVNFGFEDREAYYLYNSAYDPGVAESSPGLILIDRLVDDSVGRGLSTFDFLKGDEPYKRRLGAEARRLHHVEATS